MMFKRQHPIFILYWLQKRLGVNILGLIATWQLISGLANEFDLNAIAIGAIIVALLLLLASFGVSKWYFFTYHVDDEGITVHSGMLKKEQTFIPRDKIQTVRMQTPIVFRIFAFTSVYIEVAGGGDKPEIAIQGIRKGEAEEIIHQMTQKAKAKEEVEEVAKDDGNDFSFTIKELILGASTTSGQFLIVLGGLFTVFEVFPNVFPPELADNVGEMIGNFSYVVWGIVIVFAIAIFWLVSVIWYGYKYINFKVSKETNQICISQGLLATKEFYVENHRIQSIIIKENFLRKLIGYCSVSVEVIGSIGEDKAEYKDVFPFIKKKRVADVFDLYFPEQEYLVYWESVGKEGRGFYFRRAIWATLFTATITVIMSLIFQQMIILWAIALFTLISCIVGIRGAKWSKFAVSPRQLSMANATFFGWKTIFVTRPHIQSLEHSQSIFQRRKQVSRISIRIASTALGKDIPLLTLIKQGERRY